MPIGAFLACGEAAHAMQPGDHGSTYGGNPFVCAAASAVLDVFKEADILATRRHRVRTLTALEELKAAFPEMVKDHRGMGLIQGLEFASSVPAGEIVRKMLLEQRVILIAAEHNTIRFVPPLVIEHEHIDAMKEKLEKVLAELA